MRVAFDLDDTLIACGHDFPAERRGLLARAFGREPIRAGTVRVMKHLAARGAEVWVYTTSFRSPSHVRWLFRLYGLRIRGVVNQARHCRRVMRGGGVGRDCSKYPPAFGIDLLIDDSEGVQAEGRRHGFRVICVRPEDEGWADRVIADLDRILPPRGRERA